MKTLLIILTLLLGSPLFAEIKAESFYFDKDSGMPLSSSMEQLNELKNNLVNHRFQLIEIGSFAEDERFDRSEEISKQYIDFVVKTLEADTEEITINNYGGQRIRLNFEPRSWNRVDVYYYIGEEIEIEPSVVIKEIVDTNKVPRKELPNRKVPGLKEIAENTPIVMPITFVGGTSKMNSEGNAYLQYLAKTLKENPDYTAHIRGHVCCGDNYRMSKKRAKTVYKYLVKQEVDKKRLSYKGYSNYLPLVFPEHTKEDRAANRRVDVIFSNRN